MPLGFGWAGIPITFGFSCGCRFRSLRFSALLQRFCLNPLKNAPPDRLSVWSFSDSLSGLGTGTWLRVPAAWGFWDSQSRRSHLVRYWGDDSLDYTKPPEL